jgi:exopolysaccharide biosynthesis polyprenyl glycosylphosphotransferase
MIRLRHKLLIHFLRLFDQVVVIMSLGVFGQALASAYSLREVVAVLLLLMGSMLVFNHFVRYDANRFSALADQLASLFKAVTLTVILLLAISGVFSFPRLRAIDVLSVWAAALASVFAIRLSIRELLKYLRRSGMTSRQLLIVGVNVQARRLAETFNRWPELGYRILGFVSEQPESLQPGVNKVGEGHYPVCGELSELQSILERRPVDEVLICLPVQQYFAEIGRVVRLGEQLGIVVRIIPDAQQEAPLLRRMHLEFFEGQFVVTFFRESLLYQLMIKRFVDVGLSLLLLIVLSPLVLAVALAIKMTSPGPVFFVQERVGMNRRRFKLYKFRSMSEDAEARKAALAQLNEMDGPVFKIRNDPRVTPLGRFIRKMSIDELPQLFNVLSGSMSLVGPRPPVPSEVEKYEWLFQRRLSIKPGITCLWQVAGRNQVSFKEWMELDRQYVANWSLWLDLKILWRTIPVVLIGRGAS